MKNTRKGFTIVELVIVIAVIAILIGSMLPQITAVINNARLVAAQQWATMAYKEAYAQVMADGEISSGEKAESYGFAFTFADADSCNVTKRPDNFGYSVTVTDGKVSVTPAQ